MMKRRESSPHEEHQRAHDAGLTSPQDIKNRFDCLGRERTIVGRGGKTVEWRIPASDLTPKWSQEEQRAYEEDFQEDVAALRLRLQRVKIRIVSHLLEGTQVQKAATTWRETKETPLGQLQKRLPFTDAEASRLTEGYQAELISDLNRHLPASARLRLKAGLRMQDLTQLHGLINKLLHGTPPKKKEVERLERYLDEISALEQQIENTQTQGELFAERKGVSVNERVYENVWSAYRDLLRQIATEEELASWYSPTYGTSGKGQRGKSQESSRLRTDYQRFRMPEMERFQHRLKREYVFAGLDETPSNAETYLFNSGQAAMEAVLLDLAHKQQEELWDPKSRLKPRPIMIDKGFYFESLPILRSFADKQRARVVELEPLDADTWVKRLLRDLPQAVFLDPMSIGLEMRVNPLADILDKLSSMSHEAQSAVWKRLNARSQDYARVRLVIDNTSLGLLADWKTHIQRLPSFIQIYVVESLIKYAQDGQELTQAGIVTAFDANRIGYPGSHLQNIQASHGLRPPESVVRRLAAVPPAEDIVEKMHRHSRNATLLAADIQHSLSPNGYLQEVIYPGLETHPDFHTLSKEASGAGGLFNIRIGPDTLEGYTEWFDFKPLDEYDGANKAKHAAEAFEQLVLRLAKEAGVEINSGTSYGFSSTRLAIYSHGVLSAPYLRVAVGTENRKNLKLISEVIKRANEIFSRAWREKKLITLTHALLERENAMV